MLLDIPPVGVEPQDQPPAPWTLLRLRLGTPVQSLLLLVLGVRSLLLLVLGDRCLLLLALGDRYCDFLIRLRLDDTI